MTLDTDFPFGANEDTSIRTEVIDTSDLRWAAIEAIRKAARADVATVADPQWTRALSYVARLQAPALKAWASRWLTYCTVGGDRPIRHIGEAGKACRRVELKLSRLGVVDPDGFEAIEQNAPRSSAAREKRRRQKRGGECNGLKEFNERMRAPWVS
jgi:hypothetical protein